MIHNTYEIVEGKLTFGEYEVNTQNSEMTVIKLGTVKLENIIVNLSLSQLLHCIFHLVLNYHYLLAQLSLYTLLLLIILLM